MAQTCPMLVAQTFYMIIPAKQSMQNSCVSACIGTAIGRLAGDQAVGTDARDALESRLGNNPATLVDAARLACQLFSDFTFTAMSANSLRVAIAAAKSSNVVVIVGFDAAKLYGEPNGPRPHALVVNSTSSSSHVSIETWAEQQSVVDPDPAKDGRAFSIGEAEFAFLAAHGAYQGVGEYLVVARRT